MSTLNDRDIREYNTRLVEPFNNEQVQPASYDLRLGFQFIRFSTRGWHTIDLADMKDDSAERVTVDPAVTGSDVSPQYVIAPGEFILGVSSETVKCPPNIVGRLEGKSTIGRVGLLIHVTAGFVDPGWCGPLTLEIYNVRRVPIILRPGRLFCQMSWQFMTPPDEPYHGRYQNAAGVEASKAWQQPESNWQRALREGNEARSKAGVEILPSPLSACCNAVLLFLPNGGAICSNCNLPTPETSSPMTTQ